MGDGHRTRVWDFIHDRIRRELPDVEIVVGTDDGEDPFHKTLALNRAVAASSGDIIGIWDADTWVPPEQVRIALAGLWIEPARWWRPWSLKYKFREHPTMQALEAGEAWDGDVSGIGLEIRPNGFASAPPVMLSRESYALVGGMDERFRGWGSEDEAFSFACRGVLGPGDTVQGKAVHLWHPRRGRSGRDLWEGQENTYSNSQLMKEYHQARTPKRMRELIETTRGGP
jgi:hypothetical protein